MSTAAARVEGPLWTRSFRIIFAIAVVGLIVMAWRFLVGLGAATGLNDGYPWGLWITFDVVCGTAFGCGGYAVAILVYILNKGKYHPLVRPAILTSALGYTMGGLAVAVDVGRPWLVWKVPFSPTKWNFSSAQLEVALCIMAYMIVLWIELAPAFLERWKDSDHPGLARFSQRSLGFFEKALIWIIALGVLLPTMHQSSLGTMMLLAGPKLSALWATPMVPLLFLLGCIVMGYGVVVMESSLSARFFGRQRETAMLASLSRAIVVVLALWLVIRLVDLVVRGQVAAMFGSGSQSFWLWVELLLAAAPLAMLLVKSRLRDSGWLFGAAALAVVGGTLYRFNAYLTAFDPGVQYTYFPTVPEIFITVGMLALELTAFIWLVKTFPILSGTRPPATHEV
jgi:Ni/Fe-hydrogenase subunit HybB-like protein